MVRKQPPSERRLERFVLLNSLWPFCYSTALILSHSYLVYRGVRRYIVYKDVLPYTTFLLTTTCTVAVLLPVIVATSFLRLGSYANDGAQVGYELLRKEIPCKGQSSRGRLRLGVPPIAPVIHVICAYLLLIANTLVVTQALRLYIASGFNEQTTPKDLPPALPHFSIDVYMATNILSLDLELANLLVALTVLSYKNASSFWQTSRAFTLIYWLQTVAALTLHVLSHFGLQSLLTGILTQEVFLLNETSLIALYALSNGVLVVSSWCVFHFGYSTVREHIRCCLKQFGCHIDVGNDWAAYLPHGLALTSILIYVGCSAPVMYDYVTEYGRRQNRLLIAHLAACVLYMLLWTVLWFLFTVKQNWKFSVDEVSLKRYVVLQNRHQFFPSSETIDTQDGVKDEPAGEMKENGVSKPSTDVYIHHRPLTDDSLSNSTTSTANDGNVRYTNGILAHKVGTQARQKRNTCEQKVKFQEATKIVIETNLDSDLDTIPESDTECADSAMFSGSNDSTESTTPQASGTRQNYKDLILSPKNVPTVGSRRRMWSSTGDLGDTNTIKQPARPSSVVSEQMTSTNTAPYSPRNLPMGRLHAYNSDCMSSAV